MSTAMNNTSDQEASSIAAVLTDVDGTLVTKDKVLTERALRAVKQLRERGIVFTITSGRPPFGMRMLVEPLGLTMPMAAFNGGVIVLPDLSVLDERLLPDSRVGRALALIHERLGEAWTVAKLAAKAGLSRSAFTVRFTKVVGESPQAYLIRVRMQRAARLLREQDDSLGRITLAVGYESESSFNKAFKRQYRKTPGQFRREQRGNRSGQAI